MNSFTAVVKANAIIQYEYYPGEPETWGRDGGDPLVLDDYVITSVVLDLSKDDYRKLEEMAKHHREAGIDEIRIEEWRKDHEAY